jgi:hypothetical protein
MCKSPSTVQRSAAGSLPEPDHLNDLLDDALAGTFPASDPTSSFVCERERPECPQPGSIATSSDHKLTRHVNAALLVERSESTRATKFAATLPEAWRAVIDPWIAGSSLFLVVIDLPTGMLVGTPAAIADVRAMIGMAGREDPGAIVHLKFMCTDVTAAAIIDDPAVAAVDWNQPPTRH